ncbi:MAG TPA: threonine synthase [Pseudomonadota bacterium]|nr:threonine synthase [Pseudomonadota bacterium]
MQPHSPPTTPPIPSARFHVAFRCAKRCTQQAKEGEICWPLSQVNTRCPLCGGLLDVVHDLAALSTLSGAAWRSLYEDRKRSFFWPNPSGVWCLREWVNPDLTDEDIVSLGEGNTPLVPVPLLGQALGVRDLWIKVCGSNPTGSFKDLGMTGLVSQVHRLRRLGFPIPAVACASTGDTSAALAAFCARAQLPAIVFLPVGKLSHEQLVQPLCNGAITVALEADFDRLMELVAEFCERTGVYLANSQNPLRIEGQKTLSVEVAHQLGWESPDWIVIPGGNLGNTTAIMRGFGMARTLGVLEREPRPLIAQAEQASPLVESFRDGWKPKKTVAGITQATAIAIGNPVNAEKAIAELVRTRGVVEAATEEEITAAWLLSDRHGMQTDPQTGVALAAVAKQVRIGNILPHQRVVVVSTAHGLKFGRLKQAFHLNEPTSPKSTPESDPLRNAPLRLPAHLPTLENEILRRIERLSHRWDTEAKE